MPILVLLNGGPASGKSTLAQLWARERPLALAVDVDHLRAMIADWEDHPTEAGLRARELALAMIANHLADGHDVIVPQYLATTPFIEQLEQTAAATGARFIEAVLLGTADVTERRFRERAARAERAEQSSKGHTVHGPLGSRSMRELLEEHGRFLGSRGAAVMIEPVDGDIPASLDRLTTAIQSRAARS